MQPLPRAYTKKSDKALYDTDLDEEIRELAAVKTALYTRIEAAVGRISGREGWKSEREAIL